MEQYLADLNRVLSENNRLTTLQVQLTSQPDRVGEGETAFQRGRVVRSSLFVEQAAHERAIAGHTAKPTFSSRIKKVISERILFLPGIHACITRPFLSKRRIPARDGEPRGLVSIVSDLHRRYPVDLICLHSAGSADSAELLDFAAKNQIPVVYVHHFSNDRLASFSMRTQIEKMAAVGGVTGVDVPRFAQRSFDTVADGIDTDFFQKKNASLVHRTSQVPLIFLGARITPTKGQADVIRAAGELKRRGIAFEVAFGGRLDSPGFEKEIQDLILAERVEDRVFLLGQLNSTQLRDWYGAAAVLAFPTRHHEGLPRILLECQAMGVPPVVFDRGGTSEGIIDGQTGYLVEPGDFKTLVTRLQTLLEQPELRGQFAVAGRKLVESKFSLAALAVRHEEFYLRALERNRH